MGRWTVTPETSAKQRAAGVAMGKSDVDFKLQLYRLDFLLLLRQGKSKDIKTHP